MLFPLPALALVGAAVASIEVGLISNQGVQESFLVNPDGSCFSLNGGDLAQFNDNLKEMDIPTGYECVIWQNFNCQGGHSNVIQGQQSLEEVCNQAFPNQPDGSVHFETLTSAFRCCPKGAWCVPGGGTPDCGGF